MILKAELSVSSLDNLLKELREYREKVESLDSKLPQELASNAESYISQNLADVMDRDGNVDVSTGTDKIGNTARAYMDGSQAAYIEFGTGVKGKQSPHELAAEVGWEYDSGERIFTTKDGRRGWVYKDPISGLYYFTEGIPAMMPVLNAAREIKNEVAETARELMK